MLSCDYLERALSLPQLQHYHCALFKRYSEYGNTIMNVWASLNKQERHTFFLASMQAGSQALHELPPASVGMELLLPEWNAHNIVESDTQIFLDLIELRATRSSWQQTFLPFKGFESDWSHAKRILGAENPTTETVHFATDEQLVRSPGLYLEDRKSCCQPRLSEYKAGTSHVSNAYGHLIMQRQIKALASSLCLVEIILNSGSKKPTRSVIQPAPAGPATMMSGFLGLSLDHVFVAHAYIEQMTTRPNVLAYLTNLYLGIRPELVPDEKGRKRDASEDEISGAAFFDAINARHQYRCSWEYIHGLFCLLQVGFNDKPFRLTILQQLSNVFQMEYLRTQTYLRHLVQGNLGRTCFRRIENATDSLGNARTVLKSTPDSLVAPGTELYYLLVLCQPETTRERAVTVMAELWALDFLSRGGSRHRRLDNDLKSALAYFHKLLTIITDLQVVFPMPSFSRTREATFVSKFRQLESKFIQSKGQIRVGHLAYPVRKLGQLGMAKRAMDTLDEWAIRVTGNTVAASYESVVDDCLFSLNNQRLGINRPTQAITIEQSSMPGRSTKKRSTRNSLTERRLTEGPPTENLLTEGPLTEKPSSEKPLIEEPLIEKPLVEEPSIEKPLIDEPPTERPSTEQPALISTTVHATWEEAGQGKRTLPAQLPPTVAHFAAESALLEPTALHSPTTPVKSMPAEVQAAISGNNLPLSLTQSPSPSARRKSTLATLTPAKKRLVSADSEDEHDKPLPPEKIRVSMSAERVFSALFDKSTERGSLHWASFEAAMAELEFRITPRQGSAIAFEPPKSLNLARSITIHRPHGPRIEGFRTIFLAQRLTRAFGWDENTFVVR